jgi:hypothetical protein
LDVLLESVIDLRVHAGSAANLAGLFDGDVFELKTGGLVSHREPPLGFILGLIDFELRVSIVAEDLFELEHLTRPVIFEQDHLHVAVRIYTGQRCSKFANRHRGVLTHVKDLHAVQVSSRILPHPMHTRAVSPSQASYYSGPPDGYGACDINVLLIESRPTKLLYTPSTLPSSEDHAMGKTNLATISETSMGSSADRIEETFSSSPVER